jgi:predicted metalloprotease
MPNTMSGISPESEPAGKKHPPRLWRASIARAAAGALLLGAYVWSSQAPPHVSKEPAASARAAAAGRGADQGDAFVERVMKDMDSTFAREFERRGKAYQPAKLVLFSLEDSPVCSATFALLGKKPCPENETYIDASFQAELSAQLGKDADAPRAYTIAHEVGHHVQRVLGLTSEVGKLLLERPVAAHAVQVQMELQADCFAGVWARSSALGRELLPRGSIENALKGASDVGKERQMSRTDGVGTASETFTYAIPRQRLFWFYKGFASGQVQDCDTFAP